MNYTISDYTFWGLMNNGLVKNTPINTLGYFVALVDSPQNEIVNLDMAHFVLSYLSEIEEQVESASELLSRLQSKHFPKEYCPQTPMMLTLEWSPISAMLENDWQPLTLIRGATQMACASGIWEAKPVESDRSYQECQTPEQLFWYIMSKVTKKAKKRELLISIIAKPGWDYEDDIGELDNLTLAEAEKADRVIWQRTPNV